ncbi:type II toxin-antitoxin system PrlF family antitoxin [Janthinobacterium sp.]|uniref:type II toxin-antitoxin system PrlF family antitoxin n=1 Tax=Janthinobacterium sp. TaxID=1871054 RepID=UPI00293D8B1E|nr:type II toxin-antitoxin system PrlF family antitoxin [Janthinobacterium sp.]
MSAIIEVQSTLTDRYQTTVPETVRLALNLGKRDKLRYTIRPDGAVVITRVDEAESDDPVLGSFLSFLASDIARHPEKMRAIDATLLARVQALVGGVEVDLNAPLAADDE